MEKIIVGCIVFFGFLFYIKIKHKADGKVLIGRARTKLEKGNLDEGKRLIYKAHEHGAKQEVIDELIQEYNLN